LVRQAFLLVLKASSRSHKAVSRSSISLGWLA